MIGFIVDVEFVWGFQARVVGLSKTSPSFYYPPPTTFLGAMAEVVAKENNVGEDIGKLIVNEFGRNLLAIGFRPINCIPIKYEDLNKVIAVKITSGIQYPDPSDLGKSFDSPARGKTILSSLDERPPKIRWFLVFRDKEIQVQDDILRSKIEKIVMDEDLFWRITRLGSKESLVCVENVKAFGREEMHISSGYITTNYAFPVASMKVGDEKTKRWGNEIYVNPFNGNIYQRSLDEKRKYKDISGIFGKYFEEKDLIIFKIPTIVLLKDLPEYIVILDDHWRVYSVSYEDGREAVIGRWQI